MSSTTALPARTVPCTRCGATPGNPCTSHNGTRTRPHDVHQDRTALYRATETRR